MKGTIKPLLRCANQIKYGSATNQQSQEQGMFNRFALIGAIAIVACAPTAALAKPKQGGTTTGCKCTCAAPSGVNNGTILSENTYNPVGGSCAAFPGKTCNVNNPNTGGVSTGELLWCDAVQGSATSAIKNGALLHGPFFLEQSSGKQNITRPAHPIDPGRLHVAPSQ